jgi:DNA (cytosine-5)-methyltransferase 1
LESAGEISLGIIDDRSIKDVKAKQVTGYRRAHFFAGIGGWEIALRIAGWPNDRPVWTGSCPCQPYSSAGKQKGDADERNLWPDWFKLIQARRPVTIFGEQVASAIGHGWLDRVFADLEGENYTCGAVVLGAHSVGAPHIRQRLFWVADRSGSTSKWDARAIPGSEAKSSGERVENGDLHQRFADVCDSQFGGLADSNNTRSQGWIINQRGCFDELSAWSPSVAIECRDGKSRRIPVPESGVFPLAHGIPRKLGSFIAGVPSVAERAARANRVGRLKGYGNAIVPQVAAEFVRAFLGATE